MMKIRFVLILILLTGCSFCGKKTSVDQRRSETVNGLDKSKLIVILDEVLADEKLGREIESYGLDIDDFRVDPEDGTLEYSEEHDTWFLGNWTVLRKSPDEYEMVAIVILGEMGTEFYGKFGYQITIYFSTGEKYTVTGRDILQLSLE